MTKLSTQNIEMEHRRVEMKRGWYPQVNKIPTLKSIFKPVHPRFKEENDLMPSRATAHSEGYDIKYIADVQGTTLTIEPQEQVKIDSGVRLEMPPSLRAKLLIRSSLGTKHQIMLSNGTGLFESDYKKKVIIFLFNFGKDAYTIKDGDRIAQMIFDKSNIEVAKDVGYAVEYVETIRDGGLGSTGK